MWPCTKYVARKTKMLPCLEIRNFYFTVGYLLIDLKCLTLSSSSKNNKKKIDAAGKASSIEYAKKPLFIFSLKKK